MRQKTDPLDENLNENKLSRPGSGYLFKSNNEKSRSSGSQGWFNLHYFNDSNSSLNKSFVESNAGRYQHKEIPVGFKIFCIWVAAFCNSTFPIFPLYICQKFYENDTVSINNPILVNCWRLQWVALFFHAVWAHKKNILSWWLLQKRKILKVDQTFICWRILIGHLVYWSHVRSSNGLTIYVFPYWIFVFSNSKHY